jgi:transposase
MGGVPAQLVPDNPKVGVNRANWYEPGLNRTYLDLATHYGTAILPTRSRKPRDKAKVEVAVLVVERWILARLRNRRFFSLAELNRAIAELVTDLNTRPMRRLGVSRRDLFLELDCPVLKTLPAEPYEYAEWRPRRVGRDYHVDIDGHYYSVPYRLIREQLDARITERTIELFCKGERVAVHLRVGGRGRHTTIREHMQSAHRHYADWTIERIRADAAAIGPSTAKLTALILESRPHPEQGYRACIGILRLAHHYGAARLEAACSRGLDIGARSYGSIQSILKHGLDRRPPPQPTTQNELLPDHPNIPRLGPRPLPGIDCRPLDRGGAEFNHRRARRCRQELACLCPRPKSLPRQPLGAVSAHPTDVQRSRARSRRWPLSPPDTGPWRRQAVDPRRLGP